jgi:hypothetical protein
MTILYPVKPRHRRRYTETQRNVTVCAIMEENGVYLRRYMNGESPTANDAPWEPAELSALLSLLVKNPELISPMSSWKIKATDFQQFLDNQDASGLTGDVHEFSQEFVAKFNPPAAVAAFLTGYSRYDVVQIVRTYHLE